MSFLNVALFGDALKNDRLPGFELWHIYMRTWNEDFMIKGKGLPDFRLWHVIALVWWGNNTFNSANNNTQSKHSSNLLCRKISENRKHNVIIQFMVR
jgi:hypothetical protein